MFARIESDLHSGAAGVGGRRRREETARGSRARNVDRVFKRHLMKITVNERNVWTGFLNDV